MFDELLINLKGNELKVGLCDSEESRSKGLMGVRHMPDDCGMLFQMNNPGPVDFWMKNTHIPLDIIAMDKNFEILKVGYMKPHTGKFHCDGPVAYVLEVNGGWCESRGISMNRRKESMKTEDILKGLVEATLLETWERPCCFGDIVYRPFSDAFFFAINEMKMRCNSLSESTRSSKFDDFHREALSTDIGEFGLYEGVSVPLDIPIPEDYHAEFFMKIHEATKKLPPNTKLNQPKRSGGGTKYHVYVRDPKTGNVKKVGFGAKGMGVGIHDPARVKSFVARHKCHTRNDKTTASYWSCRLPRFWKSLGLKKTSKKWW